MLGRCSLHHRFPVCSSGGNSNRRSFSGVSLVSAFFLVVPGPRGVAGRAGPPRRSRHGVALGPAVCPEMERRLHSRLRPTNDSWRVDETYIRVRVSGSIYTGLSTTPGQPSTSFYRLNATQQRPSAFSPRTLGGESHPAPRVINTDEHAGYPPAIMHLKAEEALEENCRHRPVQYLNNLLEKDHRAIKRRIRESHHFRSFRGAWHTIAGYEAIHMTRKGQARGSAPAARGGLLHRFILGLFSAVAV